MFFLKLVLILLISNFFSYSFYRSLFFQFSSSIVISHMFCFLFRSLFFFPETFVEVFLSFNFIIQLNFLFCSFDLFFLLLKLFFNSI
jgi:hypothetical protein